MKFVFINSSRRFLAGFFLSALLGLVVFAAAKAQAQQLSYTNIGTFPANSPTVNATNVYNLGSWSVATTPLPYTTLNTLNYYNSGSMSGAVGWNFSLNTSGGSNLWSASFTNNNYNPGTGNGSITAISSLGGLPQLFPVGYLLVSATNLVNKGLLSADTYSTIRLTGNNVDVSRSFIQISPVSTAGSTDNNSQSDFNPSQSIYDEYWGEGAATKLNSAAIANFFNTSLITAQSPTPQTPAPAYPVGLSCSSTGSTSVFIEPATLVSALNNPSGISHVAITNQVILTNQMAYTNQFVYTNMGVLATNLVAFTNFMYQVTNVVPAMVNVVSNLNRQAVFVGTADPNISGAVRYTPGDAGSNLETVTVQLSVPYTNLTTLTVQTNYIYVSDTLASEPYTGLYVNNFESVYPCYDFTYRPANYIVSRSDPGTFARGSLGNATLTSTNNFLFSSTGQSPANSVNSLYTDATNPVVNVNYALYSATVDNEAIPSASVGNVTNLPGNIRITANNLNLSKSIIQAEGEVMIKATNLVSSAGAVIDCPNLDYNVGSTNGFLSFTNLAKPYVSRLTGTVNLWSADWVNQASVLTTNYAFTTNAVVVTNAMSGIAVTNLIATTNLMMITNVVVLNNTDTNGNIDSSSTNFIVSTNITISTVTASVSTNPVAIGYSVLLVDASGLISSLPVQVQNLALNSANAVVSDSMNIANGFYFSGTNLTLNGAINMLGTNWSRSLTPNLLYFTNNNNLNIGGTADFGDDGAIPYIAFVDNGSINASSVNISSSYYQESGVENTTPGGFVVKDTVGEVVDGNINSAQDIDFNGSSLALTNASLSAAGAVNFNVTTSLIDAANYSAPNEIISVDGFNMLIKPTTCNLLGTEFIASSLPNAEVDSTWAGQNLGAVAAGYSNNAAIGMLVLSPQSEVFQPLFTFSGIGTVTNALYVDDLNLSQLSTNDFADLENQLQINPNLIIYYASAQLGFTPPTKTVGTNNVPQEPEEFLNGQFGGHLIWVSSYAGAYSSTNILINGQTVSVNSALANSQIIDSNGNGIPNAFDSNPFGFTISGSLSSTNAPINKVFTISWVAVANSTYQIQFTTNLILGNWQTLLNYTNSSTTNQSIMINDTNKLSPQRFYRELNLSL